MKIQNENIKNFKKALLVEKFRKKGQKIPKRTINPSLLIYTEGIKFYKYIKKYFDIFPKEQIKIILLDDLKERPEKIYEETLKFLKVGDINFKPELKIYNKSNKINSLFLWRLLKSHNYTKIKKALKKIMPKSIRVKLITFLKRINEKDQNYHKPLDKKFELELKKEFKENVEKLDKLIDRDLVALWGYDKLNK